MTVPPVQDLITDVMAAADPAAQRIATSKLERLAPLVDANFAATVDQRIQAGEAAESKPSSSAGSAVFRPEASTYSGHAQIINKPTGGHDAYRKFEAFVLQMFVESMLPKDATDVFGKGTAGTVWRSMLAEQISNEMAKGNGVGIAKQLAKSRAIAESAGIDG